MFYIEHPRIQRREQPENPQRIQTATRSASQSYPMHAWRVEPHSVANSNTNDTNAELIQRHRKLPNMTATAHFSNVPEHSRQCAETQ
jgi:hypothetical protein